MKKWLTILEDQQYDWIDTLATETDVPKSVVLRAALDRARTVDTGDFKRGLIQAQIKEALLKLDTEEREIAEQKKALQQKIKSVA